MVKEKESERVGGTTPHHMSVPRFAEGGLVGVGGGLGNAFGTSASLISTGSAMRACTSLPVGCVEFKCSPLLGDMKKLNQHR